LDFAIEWLTQLMSQTNHPVGYVILVASSALEYLFPPFPGDTVILFGGVLVAAYDWSLPLCFVAIFVGSQGGAIASFYLGRAAQRSRKEKPDSKLSRVVARFRQHGPAYLVLNRFVPGLRPFFFIAAGMAGMSAAQAFVWSAVSNVLWIAALFLLGGIVGDNLPRLVYLVQTYSLWAGLALAAIVVVALARALLRRRASSRNPLVKQ